MQLSKKQNEYIVNATHRWNIKSGAVRSGKSYVDTAFVIPFRIRERAGKPGLNVILGVSKESIERNVLQPMREIYTDKLIGTINNRNVARICGEDVYCLGAEKISQVAKIQGASIKYCYGDEVAKWNKEVFQMLKSRLDKPYSCFDGSCNPEHPTHWLKEFLDNIELDIYLQRYTIFDNPFLPEEFVQQLCKEYEGTIYYDRLILGMWKRAEHWILFAAFLLLNVADWITGWMKSKMANKENSVRGWKGVLKKLGYWLMIMVAFGASAIFIEIGKAIGVDLGITTLLGWFVLASLLINEIRSILENFVEAGFNVPIILIKGLEVADKVVNKDGDSEGE